MGPSHLGTGCRRPAQPEESVTGQGIELQSPFCDRKADSGRTTCLLEKFIMNHDKIQILN